MQTTRLVGLLALGGLLAAMAMTADRVVMPRARSTSSKPAKPSAPEPVIEMTAEQRKAFLEMTTWQARHYINADGESCPEATGGALSYFPDSGRPFWLISCSDGSRYVVFWRSDIGRIKVQSCP